MKNIFMFLLITMLASGIIADNRHPHDGPVILVEEYPDENIYELVPIEERVKQWQAMYARGELGTKDPQKKRNVDVINSLLALPKGLNAAGRR